MPHQHEKISQVELPRNMKKDRIGIDATNADKVYCARITITLIFSSVVYDCADPFRLRVMLLYHQ